MDHSQFTGTGLMVIVASMLLHGLYVVLLAATYSVGDFFTGLSYYEGHKPNFSAIAGSDITS